MKSRWSRGVITCIVLCLIGMVGCAQKPAEPVNTSAANTAPPVKESPADSQPEPAQKGTADPSDVKAAKARIDELGPRASYSPKKGDLVKEVVILDGSKLKAEDIELFGKLTDLEKLQIFNFRTLNDEMASKLSGLSHLTSLALTNSVINDSAVEMIVKSFPGLVELDLSSNTNMTSGVLKIVSAITNLRRLTLVQNRINDIGAMRLSKLQDLRSLDLRGNMEAGDMALKVIGALPKLTSFKHRSTAVTDSGLEQLSNSPSLESLLIQDFIITDQSGPSFAKLSKLSQLEVFRCQGFGTEGVLALKGMGLSRLKLRDLPNIDDRAMEVLDNLPELKRLYLHELSSITDSGLAHLSSLKTLEVLDIWTIPRMTDATVELIAALPQLKELSLRATGVTDASIEKIMSMPNLQVLTFKENGSVTADGLKKLSSKKWAKLDLGTSGAAETSE